jgi:hypothetical protein
VAQVAQRHDAHELAVPIDHRQPANLLFTHFLQHVTQVLVVPAALHFRRHELTSRALHDILVACRQSADHKVTVSDHAEQLLVLHDGNRADVFIAHDARHISQPRLRRNRLYVRSHDVANLLGHVVTPWVSGEIPPRPMTVRARASQHDQASGALRVGEVLSAPVRPGAAIGKGSHPLPAVTA